jgi:hypothetical protein
VKLAQNDVAYLSKEQLDEARIELAALAAAVVHG